MKSHLTLLSCLLSCSLLYGQKTIKTQLLVIGTTAAGIGAGVQAAKAGVKTIIIDSTLILGTDLDQLDTTFTLGLDGLYFKELKDGKTRAEIMNTWLNQRKELKLLTGVKVSSSVQLTKGWEIKLSNGQRVLAYRVFEDIGPQRVEYRPGKFIMDYDVSITTDNWPGFQCRTLLGTPRGSSSMMKFENMVNAYPVSRFVKTEKENWIVIPAIGKTFSIGQIVGAMAAGAIPPTSKEYDVRAVQKTLLKEGLYLDSFNDIPLDDPNFIVFQRICATGILSGNFYMPGGMKFFPEEKVKIKYLKRAFIDYYPGTVVWFEKHPMGNMSIAEALDLLFVASHQSLEAQIQTEWNGKLQFRSEFKPENTITRREFAVLLDTYLKPFDVKIDMMGRIR